jgi:hypothetical protein
MPHVAAKPHITTTRVKIDLASNSTGFIHYLVVGSSDPFPYFGPLNSFQERIIRSIRRMNPQTATATPIYVSRLVSHTGADIVVPARDISRIFLPGRLWGTIATLSSIERLEGTIQTLGGFSLS